MYRPHPRYAISVPLLFVRQRGSKMRLDSPSPSPPAIGNNQRCLWYTPRFSAIPHARCPADKNITMARNQNWSRDNKGWRKSMVTSLDYRTSQRYSNGIEKTILRRRCDESSGFSTSPPSLFLSLTIARSNRHRQRAAGIVLERGKETLRVNETRAGSAGHYLLLTIFMCLSIAEISTRCDDIDWHAVKPSDMRLRRSPSTSASTWLPRVSSSFSSNPLPTL